MSAHCEARAFELAREPIVISWRYYGLDVLDDLHICDQLLLPDGLADPLEIAHFFVYSGSSKVLRIS